MHNKQPALLRDPWLPVKASDSYTQRAANSRPYAKPLYFAQKSSDIKSRREICPNRSVVKNFMNDMPSVLRNLMNRLQCFLATDLMCSRRGSYQLPDLNI